MSGDAVRKGPVIDVRVTWGGTWTAHIAGGARVVSAESIPHLRVAVEGAATALVALETGQSFELAWTFVLADGSLRTETQAVTPFQSVESSSSSKRHQARVDRHYSKLRQARGVPLLA